MTKDEAREKKEREAAAAAGPNDHDCVVCANEIEHARRQHRKNGPH